METDQEGYKKLYEILASTKGLFKSKTTYGLTAVMPTILLAIKGLGFTLTPEITAGVYVIGGLIYRWITKKPLSEK